MDEQDDPRGPRVKAKKRIFLFVVLAAALLTLAVAIYALVDRRGQARLTPSGTNYNPGQPGSTSGGPLGR